MKTNVVIISGGLTRDPESKFTTTGKQVCNFSLGTETGTRDKKESSYFECQAWEKTAENIVKYLRKGSQVIVTGSLCQRRWEKDGQKHSVVEIIARNVEFGAKPKESDAPAQDEVPQDGA
jgi:single-strand DNA-binding protein